MARFGFLGVLCLHVFAVAVWSSDIYNKTEGRSCYDKKNLGTTFSNVSECAATALVDDECTGTELIWSDGYYRKWGCRCCYEGSAYKDNKNWDLYRYRPNTVSNGHFVAKGKASTTGWTDQPDHYCQNDDDDQSTYVGLSWYYDIGVGCCSEDGTSGYRPDCDAHPATYQEAADVCNENGYRLCTVEEMENEITAGTGCWYDAQYLWTSDSCDMDSSSAHAPQHGIVDWVKANIGGGDWQRTADTDAVVVLTAKDLVILVLLATTLVLVTAVIVICIRRSGRRTKYAPVGVVSDSEAEKFRN